MDSDLSITLHSKFFPVPVTNRDAYHAIRTTICFVGHFSSCIITIIVYMIYHTKITYRIEEDGASYEPFILTDILC